MTTHRAVPTHRAGGTPAESALAELGERFWSWRALHQPNSSDDLPRIERPAAWRPDWSPPAVRRRRRDLAWFEAQCQRLDSTAAPVEVQVDHRLLRSALARVRWELDVLGSWRRDPGFYVDQSIGVAFQLMLGSPPLHSERRAALIGAFAAIPATLRTGVANLAGRAVPMLAQTTAARLADVDRQVREAGAELASAFPAHCAEDRDAVRGAANAAATALARYADELAAWATADSAAADPAVGPVAFQFFLSRVALLPFTPQELVDLGQREYERAQVLEAIAGTASGPVRPEPRDAAAQLASQRADEAAVRAFYETHGLLTLPDWLARYKMAAMPGYLAPLSWLGVTDDLTGPGRLAEDALSYALAPGPDLPFFHAANVVDNRLGIVHEGCHYYQLAQSWAHPDPLRRHYYDSTPLEGIAFYNEELLLEAGLFADSAAARRLVRTFMRLRALRLQVDAALAIGSMTARQAEEQLASLIPLDHATAAAEAASFLANPGQGGSYQIGKTQVLSLLSAARGASGAGWDLRGFHDYLWRNGTVPLSLLRWELLGTRDDLDRADALAPPDHELPSWPPSTDRHR